MNNQKIIRHISLILFFSTLCFAQETNFSGVLYLDYNFVFSDTLATDVDKDGQLDPANNINGFDIDRVYLNFETIFSEDVSSLVQLEANKITTDPWEGASKDKEPFLKNVYISIKNVVPGHKLRFGLIPAPWIGSEEKIWKHRFVSKVLPDIEGILGSVDRGLSLSGERGDLSYDLLMVNGEGKGNEVDKYKDFIGKASFSLLEREAGKVNAHLYLHKGKNKDGARDRQIFGLSFEKEDFNAMGNLYLAKDGATKKEGWTFHGVYFLSPKRWVFGRFDRFDEDKDAPDTSVSRTIFGLGHKIADKVRGAFSVQLQNGDSMASKGRQRSLHYTVEVKL